MEAGEKIDVHSKDVPLLYKEANDLPSLVKEDVYSVVGSMFRMNYPNALGYLFYPNETKDEVKAGEFTADYIRPIYDYYYDFKTKKFYDLHKEIKELI